MLNKIIIPLLLVSILIALIFVGIAIFRGPSNVGEAAATTVQSIATRINPAPITTIEDRSPTILEGAKALGELTTFEMSFAKVGLEARLRFGINYACEVKEKYAAQGTIKAGVDLQLVKVTQIDEKYKILLPPPKLTTCEVNVDSYNRTGENQVLCPADPEMYKFGVVAATKIFIESAQERQLVEEAKKQATVIIKGFAQSIAGETPVEIVFEDVSSSSSIELPESCKPQPPACWQYSGNDQGWVKYC